LNTGCIGTNQRRLKALHYIETIEHWVYRNKPEETEGIVLYRDKALHYIETIEHWVYRNKPEETGGIVLYRDN
jgi:hypothetical protein